MDKGVDVLLAGAAGPTVRFGGPAIVGRAVQQTGGFASPPFDGFALGKSVRGFSNTVVRRGSCPASQTQPRIAECRHLATVRSAAGVRNFRTAEALLGRSRWTGPRPFVKRECQLRRSQLNRSLRRRAEGRRAEGCRQTP